MYRIQIDRSLCSGFGSCIDAAPELFRLGLDGIAVVRVDTTAQSDAHEAADSCPMGAITLVRETDGAAA